MHTYPTDALDFIKAADINQDGNLNFAEMALSVSASACMCVMKPVDGHMYAVTCCYCILPV